MKPSKYATTKPPADACYMTERQKAAELQCSVSYLRKDRMRDEPTVPFLKIGKLVRYLPEKGV